MLFVLYSGVQEEYLVQVKSPHEMFQNLIRDLANVTNISNAAILFDETFMINHQYINLIQDMPVL